jgi:hypothetical protein
MAQSRKLVKLVVIAALAVAVAAGAAFIAWPEMCRARDWRVVCVTDESGAPLPGAMVSEVYPSRNQAYPAQVGPPVLTDAQGKARLKSQPLSATWGHPNAILVAKDGFKIQWDMYPQAWPARVALAEGQRDEVVGSAVNILTDALDVPDEVATILYPPVATQPAATQPAGADAQPQIPAARQPASH